MYGLDPVSFTVVQETGHPGQVPPATTLHPSIPIHLERIIDKQGPIRKEALQLPKKTGTSRAVKMTTVYDTNLICI
jgi:hypothetical protein